MGSADIEPLEPSHWFARFRALQARDCEDQQAMESSLRHAFHLVQLTPRPLRHIIRCQLTEEEFENLLGRGTLFSAAVALVPPDMRYSIRGNSPSGEVRAEVREKGGNEQFSSVRTTPENALFRAWLKYLEWLGAAGQQVQLQVSFQDQRISRSELHPPQTEH